MPRELALLLALALTPSCGEPPLEAATTGPLFVDVTESSGLSFVHQTGALGNRELPETMGGGVALLDYDGDGDLDAYFAQSGPVRQPNGDVASAPVPNELFANRGDGTFEPVPGAAGASDHGYGQGAAVGDVDGDGWVDLLALNWGPNRFFWNRSGTFEWDPQLIREVDEWSVSAAFYDGDGDGDLDLYVVNYLRARPSAHLQQGHPNGFPAYPHPKHFGGEFDRTYRNNGDGTLDRKGSTRVAGADGLPGKGLGVVPTDLDLDGFADLYVANDSTPNFLLHNQRDGTFVDVGVRGGTAFNIDGESESGMGVDAGDIDGDGDFDLVVTNLSAESNTLYVNRSSFVRKDGEIGSGRGGFADRTKKSKLADPSFAMVGFGILFEDFDRDSDLDLVVANGHILDNIHLVQPQFTYRQKNQLFLGDGLGGFVPADAVAAGSAFHAEDVTRGIAIGDLDRDGDADLIFTNNGGSPQVLLGNLTGGRWLSLTLEGPPGNTHGLGANVWIEPSDGHRILRRVESARSYASAGEAVVTLGLPSPVEAVEIQWPGGRRERWGDLEGFEGFQHLRHGTGLSLDG